MSLCHALATSQRDRKHQAQGRFIQPLHSPLNLPVWVAWTPPQTPNSTAAFERTPDSRRHPARQTHLTVPVAQPHCASGSGFPQIAHRWSARSALEPGEDPAGLGAPHHGAESHHLTAYGTGRANYIKGPPQQRAPRHVA